MIKSLFKAKPKLTEPERMVAYVVRILNEKQHERIRAAIPDYKIPKKVVRESTGEGYVPEVTAFKHGQFRLFAVETNGSLSEDALASRWKLFESYASQNNAQFYIVFPAGKIAHVKKMLADAGVDARLWQAAID